MVPFRYVASVANGGAEVYYPDSIVALNQHGKQVRLIVNGGTGQIRRILP